MPHGFVDLLGSSLATGRSWSKCCSRHYPIIMRIERSSTWVCSRVQRNLEAAILLQNRIGSGPACIVSAEQILSKSVLRAQRSTLHRQSSSAWSSLVFARSSQICRSQESLAVLELNSGHVSFSWPFSLWWKGLGSFHVVAERS